MAPTLYRLANVGEGPWSNGTGKSRPLTWLYQRGSFPPLFWTTLPLFSPTCLLHGPLILNYHVLCKYLQISQVYLLSEVRNKYNVLWWHGKSQNAGASGEFAPWTTRNLPLNPTLPCPLLTQAMICKRVVDEYKTVAFQTKNLKLVKLWLNLHTSICIYETR